MAYRFPLATLLRLREIAEQREERLLGEIQNQITQGDNTLADLARQRDGVIRLREQALTQRMPGVELINSYEHLQLIETLEASAKKHLAKLTVLREQQLGVYQAANQSTEILREIRDTQRGEFHKQQAKQEQSVLDDNFCSRRSLK